MKRCFLALLAALALITVLSFALPAQVSAATAPRTTQTLQLATSQHPLAPSVSQGGSPQRLHGKPKDLICFGNAVEIYYYNGNIDCWYPSYGSYVYYPNVVVIYNNVGRGIYLRDIGGGAYVVNNGSTITFFPFGETIVRIILL